MISSQSCSSRSHLKCATVLYSHRLSPLTMGVPRNIAQELSATSHARMHATRYTQSLVYVHRVVEVNLLVYAAASSWLWSLEHEMVQPCFSCEGWNFVNLSKSKTKSTSAEGLGWCTPKGGFGLHWAVWCLFCDDKYLPGVSFCAFVQWLSHSRVLLFLLPSICLSLTIYTSLYRSE